MPTPANAGELWEVTTEGTQEGQQVMCVWHFLCETAVDNVELRMLRAIMECFLTNIIPVAASTFQLTRVYGKRVAPTLGPIVEEVPTSTDVVQGETEGGALPSYSSLCINIHTTRGGRSGRGRKFIMGIPESATQDSFFGPTNAYWIAILAFCACVAEKFIHTGEPIGNNQITVGVYSRKIGGVEYPYNVNGFAPATVLKPVHIVSHNVSRKVRRGS